MTERPPIARAWPGGPLVGVVVIAVLLNTGPAAEPVDATSDPWQIWRDAGLGPVAGLLRQPGEPVAHWHAAADGEAATSAGVDGDADGRLRRCRLERVDLPQAVVVGPDRQARHAWRFHLRCDRLPVGAAPLVLWLGDRAIGRLIADPQDPAGLVTLLFADEAPPVDRPIGLGPAPGPARAWLPPEQPTTVDASD